MRSELGRLADFRTGGDAPSPLLLDALPSRGGMRENGVGVVARDRREAPPFLSLISRPFAEAGFYNKYVETLLASPLIRLAT